MAHLSSSAVDGKKAAAEASASALKRLHRGFYKYMSLLRGRRRSAGRGEAKVTEPSLCRQREPFKNPFDDSSAWQESSVIARKCSRIISSSPNEILAEKS